VNQNGDSEVAKYYLDRLRKFNANLLAKVQLNNEEKEQVGWRNQQRSLLDLIQLGLDSPNGVYRIWVMTMNILRRMVEFPVVNVIDEHNAIYQLNMQEAKVFYDFCHLNTGLVGGRSKRVYTILSGSAHSKFELQLTSKGMKEWQRHIQPFNQRDMEVLTQKGGVFELPESWTSDKVKMAQLRAITGMIPRELQRFYNEFLDSKGEINLEKWAMLQIEGFQTQFRNFLGKEENRGRWREFHHFIGTILSPRYATDYVVPLEGRYLFDSGLAFYDVTLGRYRPICLGAEFAFADWYFQQSPEWLSANTGSERGHHFEVYTRDTLARGEELQAIYLGEWNLESTAKVLFPKVRVRKHWKNNEIPENWERQPALYEPVSDTNQGWDFVFHDPLKDGNDRLVFVQVSTQPLRTHDTKTNSGSTLPVTFKIAKSFDGLGNSVQRLVNGITGKDCEAKVTDSGALEVSGSRLDVEFVYITAATRAQMKADELKFRKSKLAKTLPAYKNLRIVTADELIHLPNMRWLLQSEFGFEREQGSKRATKLTKVKK